MPITGLRFFKFFSDKYSPFFMSFFAKIDRLNLIEFFSIFFNLILSIPKNKKFRHLFSLTHEIVLNQLKTLHLMI